MMNLQARTGQGVDEPAEPSALKVSTLLRGPGSHIEFSETGSGGVRSAGRTKMSSQSKFS